MNSQFGIWVNDLGWLEESRTKNTKKDTYTSNPALWSTLKEAKKEAKELNTVWKGRNPSYVARKYKK
jgi:secreted trypsin-like serine protease